MTLTEAILNRRSVRKYEQKEISQDILNKIFEAGQQAPSAVNKQPIHFVYVTDPKLKAGLSSFIFNRFINNAAGVLVGCADVKSIMTGKWATVDATIALQNMVIAAWSMGVGSCWIGAFDEDKVKEQLKIPSSWKVVALVTLGYPAEQPKPKKKKSIEELFSINAFP